MLDADSKPLETKNKLMAIVPLVVLVASLAAAGYILYFFVV